MPTGSERGALRPGVAGAMKAPSQGSQMAVVAIFAGDEQVGSPVAAIALFTPLMFLVQGRAQDLIATASHEPADTRRALAGRIAVGLVLATGAGIGLGAAIGFDGETLLAGTFLALARGAEVGSQTSYGEYLHPGSPHLVDRSLWLAVFALRVRAGRRTRGPGPGCRRSTAPPPRRSRRPRTGGRRRRPARAAIRRRR